MAEKEPAAKKGWLKTILGTLGGLVSGAVVMYATAAFNQVVKPAKPLANFKYDAAGTTARFQNLSGSGQGWWDFGDGSALEPVAGRDTVTHTYPRPGDYTVKLIVQNILGEESERSVTVHLDAAGAAKDGPPQVAALEAVPVSPGSYAPATFKLVGKVQNAQLCLLDYGDERPPEVLADPAAAERLVTFHEPGGHVVKLVAINGSRLDTKTEIVNVEEPPSGTVAAVLTVSDTAAKVVSRQRAVWLTPGRTESVTPGWRMTAVTVVMPGGRSIPMNGRPALDLDPAALGLKGGNVRLQLTDGGNGVQMTADAGKDARGQPQRARVELLLEEQQRVPAAQDGVTSSTTLALPAGRQPSKADVALPSVPGDWVDVQRRARLKLADGDKVLWEGPVPGSASVVIGKRSYLLSTTASNGQVHLDLRDAAAGAAPAAN